MQHSKTEPAPPRNPRTALDLLHDTEYWDSTIAEAERVERDGVEPFYIITDTDGFRTVIPINLEAIPKPGSHVRYFGQPGAEFVRGVLIDRNVSFYVTAEQVAEEQRRFLLERASEKVRDLMATAGQREERWSKLPLQFQQRFAGYYQRGGDLWRAEFETYELYVCEEAVKIASVLTLEDFDNTKKAIEMADAVREKVTNLDPDHSANTIQGAVVMAFWYLKDPSRVPFMHGALCTAVGCRESMCYSINQGD